MHFDVLGHVIAGVERIELLSEPDSRLGGGQRNGIIVLLNTEIFRCDLSHRLSSVASTRLLGRMSVQCVSMYSRHACRLSSEWATVQPAGTSTKIGHSEDCPSSLTSTRYAPSGSSNG